MPKPPRQRCESVRCNDGLRRFLFSDIGQPLGIYRRHEDVEPVERLTLDAIASGVSVERHERYRHLSAHRTVVTVEAQGLPSLPVKFMPRLFAGFRGPDRKSFPLHLVGEFIGKFRKPAIAAFPLKVVAEGRS